MKKIVSILLVCILALGLFAGCKKDEPAEIKGKIILSTTSSTEDSGLLEYLLPYFTKDTGWEVETIAVGTGAALQMGRDGEADVLLVHAKADEETFVAEKHGLKRYDVMYNDFIIVGPKGGAIAYNKDVGATFQKIADQSLPFVSRGDDSGTHKKENAIWKSLNIDPTANTAYISAGQNMGATIGMAVEKKAYCMSDRATWLTYENKGDLEIVCELSEDLLNYYGVIAVNPDKNDKINAEGAQAFVDWMISKEGQALIGQFGVEKFGSALFTPNAAK